MRAQIVPMAVALLTVACQNSPGPPVAEAQTTPLRSPSVAKVQTIEVRHVVATPTLQPKTAGVPVASVGKVAPDFTLPAYYRGKFTSVKLSSYRGKWVLLCFYPGDFTFV